MLFAITTALALGCEVESEQVDPAGLEPADEIVENLRLAGYPDGEIEVRDDGAVIVGGDAEVSLEASREMVSAQPEDDLSFRQYRTNNQMSQSKRTICVNGSAFTGTLSTALNQAITNYTSQALTFDMVRTSGSTAGCDATIVASVVAGSGGLAGFPSGGNPHSWIEIGSGVAALGVAVSTHVITHELGHCIGLRHTDYYNRSISCGTGGNEGDAGYGAVHVPFTPGTAAHNGSVMNSCFNGGSTGVFTPSDNVALTQLYGMSNVYSGVVSSFAGTLDMANLDGSGHFLAGAADVTGDGRADLVSAHTNGTVYVWPGEASGAFGSAVPSFAGTFDLANLDGSGHFIVDVADVTGDKRADLVSSHTNGTAFVWPGQAGGGFGTAVVSFGGTMDMANIDDSGHFLIGAADVTGDGRADLVSAHTNGSAFVWPGQTGGGFGAAVGSFGGSMDMANLDGAGHFLIDVADVNGDGRADLVSAHTNGIMYVWPGQMNGGFGSGIGSIGGAVDMANLDGSGHYLLDLADVTGDGRADLVGAHNNGSAYLYPGQVTGGFGAAVPVFGGSLDVANLDDSGHFLLGPADVTGNGRADLVSIHTNSSAYVWPAL